MKQFLPTKEYIPSMLFIIILGSLLFYGLCYITGTNSSVAYVIEPWTWGAEYICFFFPLISVLPFSHLLYGKLKHNFHLYANIRKEKANYLMSEIVKAMLASALSVFFIYMISLVLVVFSMDHLINSSYSELLLQAFGKWQVQNPLLFGFFWSLWVGFIAALFSLFSSFLSLLSKNYFVLSLGPFFYYFIENLTTSLLGCPEYSVTTSLHLNRLSHHVMEPFTYLFGLLPLLLCLLLLSLVIAYENR